MKRIRLAGLVLAAAVAVLGVAAIPAGALPTTTVTVKDAKGQYSDYVTLSAKICPAGKPGTVAFTVDGSSDGLAGAPVYNARSGIACQRYRVPLPEGVYEIAVSFTGTDPACSAAGTGELRVKAEDAIIKYDTEDGHRVPALIPNIADPALGDLVPVRTIVEVPDGSPGDIDKAGGSSSTAVAAVMRSAPLEAGLAAAAADWPSQLVASVLEQLPDSAVVSIDVPGYQPNGRVSLTESPEPLAASQVAGIAISMSDWLYGYYRGVGSFSCTIYTRDTGLRAAAGSVVNPLISAPIAFAFFVTPDSENGPTGYAYTQATQDRSHAVACAGGLSYTASSRDRAVISQLGVDPSANRFTFTQRPSLAWGWAPTFAADWDPAMFNDPDDSPEDCPTARFFRGGIDLQ